MLSSPELRTILSYGDKSAWVFLTDTGTIRVDDIWTWRKFNEGWHAGGGRQVPNPGTNAWKSVVLAIVRASTVYDMRRIPQWTRDHAETWLAGYPAMHTRLEYPAFQDDRLGPFLLNGRTHIDRAHFWRWSRAYPAARVEPKTRQAELKNVGWVTAPFGYHDRRSRAHRDLLGFAAELATADPAAVVS